MCRNTNWIRRHGHRSVDVYWSEVGKMIHGLVDVYGSRLDKVTHGSMNVYGSGVEKVTHGLVDLDLYGSRLDKVMWNSGCGVIIRQHCSGSVVATVSVKMHHTCVG